MAIVGDKVVAFGDNAKEVLEEAKEKFPDNVPMLAKIPRAEALILIDVFNIFDICFRKNKKTVFSY